MTDDSQCLEALVRRMLHLEGSDDVGGVVLVAEVSTDDGATYELLWAADSKQPWRAVGMLQTMAAKLMGVLQRG